jgi:TRAF3-interacting protein 1
MSDLESLISNVKDKIGGIISKPKMSDKLLTKPPFRFLHDTISGVINATGFGEGLYEGAELDSVGISDKQAKISYLEKMFLLVGICTGSTLDVRAAKVVAGLEPENTNSFLCLLSDCAQNEAIDNVEAVRRALAGDEPGSSKPPLKGKAESKNAPELSNNGSKNIQSPAHVSESKGGESPLPNFDAKEFSEAPERGKSRGGTRGGKPKSSTDDVGLSGVSNVVCKNYFYFLTLLINSILFFIRYLVLI